jgi:hypothetical protein
VTDRVGVTCGLVVLARLVDGRADAARAAIAALPARRSPFARVQGTSLARLQVLRPPRRSLAARRPREHLLWAADLDAPLDGWLARACAVIGPELDAVLGHCAFWPGATDAAGVARWVAANRLRIGFSVIGSPEARVAEIGAALAERERLAAFVRETQGLGDVALRDAWRRWRAG